MDVQKNENVIKVEFGRETLNYFTSWGGRVESYFSGALDTVKTFATGAIKMTLESLGSGSAREKSLTAVENLLDSAGKIARTVEGSPELLELTAESIQQTTELAQSSILKITELAQEKLNLPDIESKITETVESIGQAITKSVQDPETVKKGLDLLESVGNELQQIRAVGTDVADGIAKIQKIASLKIRDVADTVLGCHGFVLGLGALILVPLSLNVANSWIDALRWQEHVNGSRRTLGPNLLRTAAVLGALYTANLFASSMTKEFVLDV